MTRSTRFLAVLLLLGALVAGLAPRAGAQGNAPLIIVPREGNPNQLISFSFQQADIDDVLRFLADASGKLVFKDSAVQMPITIRNQSRITVAQAIRLVQTILALRGFSLIETEDALIVTTTIEARARRSTRVTVGKDPASIPAGNEIITHIFPLENVDAVRLREELQPLFAGGGTTIVANSDTNSLIVVDEANNIRRIAEIVNRVDRNLAGEVTYEVVRLRYADAAEVAQYLTELFRPETPTPGVPQQPQPGQPGAGAAQQRGNLAQLRGRVRVVADIRSNSLIIYASPGNIEAIKQLIAEIDVNLTPRTEYRIVPLQFADATGLADQLMQLIDPTRRPGTIAGFGGFGGGNQQRTGDQGFQEYRVVPDVRTNSLIITAPVDAIEGLVQLVRQLDQPSQVQNVVRVFQLENAIASEVATTLRSLFLGNQQAGGFGFGLFGAGAAQRIPIGSPLDLLRQVTIVPNDQTNTLLISGPSQTFPVIEELLSPDTGLDRRLPQVFIEVVIADITLNDENRFGFEWQVVAGSNTLGTNFGLNDPTADTTGFRYSVVSNNVRATLQALQRDDRVKVISTPHVMVTDNSPALITIGERIPYAGETTITSGIAQSSVEFQDVAITLNVTPHISPGNHILMDIDQVVNSLIEFVTVAPGSIAPRTTNRRAGTTVIVQNNQTVVLGGIISDNETRSVDKVPILGDLPLIGSLFRNTVKTKGRTELVVFITPHIVREPGDAEEIRQYERNRLQVDPLKVLDAPFAKPLELNAEDLRQRRARPFDPSQPLDRSTPRGTPLDFQPLLDRQQPPAVRPEEPRAPEQPRRPVEPERRGDARRPRARMPDR